MDLADEYVQKSLHFFISSTKVRQSCVAFPNCILASIVSMVRYHDSDIHIVTSSYTHRHIHIYTSSFSNLHLF